MKNFIIVLTGFWSSVVLVVQGFPVRTPQIQKSTGPPRLLFPRIPHPLSGRKDDWEEDDDDDDDEATVLEEQDWRDFRAKLVMSEGKQQASPSPQSGSEAVIADDGDLDGIGSIFQDTAPPAEPSSDVFVSEAGVQMTPLDPSQWAYESGKVIEQGAVILGGVEQDFGFGLRQQYFHKAAILVLDHEESTFTKGIILNRPTDLTLEDDINEGVKWRVWFGGDVQGLNSAKPDIVCLHSLKNEQAAKASIKIMKDIQWTTFENAKRLVQVGAAKPTDFWVFCGYAGWGPNQLMGELDRKSWYMVATDSQTLLKELGRQSAASDPREAGLDTWTLMMNMIGRSETAKRHSGDFDDLMLKEWALKNLLSSEAGGGAGDRSLPADAAEGNGLGFLQEESFKQRSDPLEKFMDRVKGTVRNQRVTEGTVVRASAEERSPFLLDGQEFHKSVVLVLNDDDGLTVGAILNRPASKGLDIQIKDKNTGKSKTVKVPLRFGGQYAVKGSEPLLWLHCSATLRNAGVGSPVGENESGICKCTAEEVIASIGRGLAQPDDFIVVSGVSVWAKPMSGGHGKGVQADVDTGKFEIVPEGRIDWVWKSLSKQDVLTNDNLSLNLELATEAWDLAGKNGPKNGANKNGKSNGKSELPPMKGLGDGFDEEDDSLVFKSNVKVAKLSDDALRSWITTFLLGMPLGGI